MDWQWALLLFLAVTVGPFIVEALWSLNERGHFWVGRLSCLIPQSTRSSKGLVITISVGIRANPVLAYSRYHIIEILVVLVQGAKLISCSFYQSEKFVHQYNAPHSMIVHIRLWCQWALWELMKLKYLSFIFCLLISIGLQRQFSVCNRQKYLRNSGSINSW